MQEAWHRMCDCVYAVNVQSLTLGRSLKASMTYPIVISHTSQDIILSLFSALGLGAGGVAMAVFARDWTDFDQPGFTFDAGRIHDSLIASAVSCSAALCVCVSVLSFARSISDSIYCIKTINLNYAYRFKISVVHMEY